MIFIKTRETQKIKFINFRYTTNYVPRIDTVINIDSRESVDVLKMMNKYIFLSRPPSLFQMLITVTYQSSQLDEPLSLDWRQPEKFGRHFVHPTHGYGVVEFYFNSSF